MYGLVIPVSPLPYETGTCLNRRAGNAAWSHHKELNLCGPSLRETVDHRIWWHRWPSANRVPVDSAIVSERLPSLTSDRSPFLQPPRRSGLRGVCAAGWLIPTLFCSLAPLHRRPLGGGGRGGVRTRGAVTPDALAGRCTRRHAALPCPSARGLVLAALVSGDAWASRLAHTLAVSLALGIVPPVLATLLMSFLSVASRHDWNLLWVT